MNHLKYMYLFAGIMSACLFTGCADRPAESRSSDSAAEAVTTAPAATTSSTAAVTATTTVTTTVVTTTQKIDPPDDLHMTCLDTVEAGSDITLDAFITDRNVALKDGSALLDTSNPGWYNAEIPYLYHGAEFTHTLQYHVIDTTIPYVINPGLESYHKVETPFDLNDYIGFADNCDSRPVLTYEGEIDPDTVGSYPLAVTVTDSSGNYNTWNITVNVVEEVPKSVDTEPRVNYSDFISR